MKYVAFLRGISPMNAPSAKLRAVFDALAFSNVQTVIFSGNVIFDSPETNISLLEKRIEEQLQAGLAIRSAAIIRSSEQIRELIQSAPFGDRTHNRETYLTVTFLKHELKEAPTLYKSANGTLEIVGYDAQNRALLAVNNVAITKTPDFMAKLEKQFGKDITTRTWNTILRINQKISH